MELLRNLNINVVVREQNKSIFSKEPNQEKETGRGNDKNKSTYGILVLKTINLG